MLPDRAGGSHQEWRRKPQGPLKILRSRAESAEQSRIALRASAADVRACPASGIHTARQAWKASLAPELSMDPENSNA